MIALLLGVVMTGTVIAQPQPKHSEGLIVIYGSQRLIEANADWHGYDLSVYPNRCGISGISPAMLGRIAWVKVGNDYDGPCAVVDAVGAQDAIDSIEGRHEVAEVSFEQALRLDETFTNGGRMGEVFFDECPPDERFRHEAESYILERDYSQWPFRWSSFYPYPEQEFPVNCDR